MFSSDDKTCTPTLIYSIFGHSRMYGVHGQCGSPACRAPTSWVATKIRAPLNFARLMQPFPILDWPQVGFPIHCI